MIRNNFKQAYSSQYPDWLWKLHIMRPFSQRPLRLTLPMVQPLRATTVGTCISLLHSYIILDSKWTNKVEPRSPSQ